MLVVFYYYIYLFSSWSLYRLLTKLSEPLDEFVFKPIIWLVPLLFFSIFIEKTPLVKNLGFDTSNIRKDGLLGAGVALGLYGFVVVTGFVKYHTIVINPFELSLPLIGMMLLASLATAIVEEITFRGFILKKLSKTLHSNIHANLLTTLLFLLIHLPMYAFTQILTIPEIAHVLVLSGIISFIGGVLFHQRKGIIAPIAAHAVWNSMALLIR